MDDRICAWCGMPDALFFVRHTWHINPADCRGLLEKEVWKCSNCATLTFVEIGKTWPGGKPKPRNRSMRLPGFD